MNEDQVELQKKLREAETATRSAQASVKDLKASRVKLAIGSGAAGLLLFAVGGHWFPGYQLDSTAAASSTKLASAAVSSVRAELCAERFLKASGLEERMAGLEEASGSWNKSRYIREGAWATTADGAAADQATGEKCHNLIAEHIAEESTKES